MPDLRRRRSDSPDDTLEAPPATRSRIEGDMKYDTETVIIDEAGDCVLFVQPPATPFAEWADSTAPGPSPASSNYNGNNGSHNARGSYYGNGIHGGARIPRRRTAGKTWVSSAVLFKTCRRFKDAIRQKELQLNPSSDDENREPNENDKDRKPFTYSLRAGDFAALVLVMDVLHGNQWRVPHEIDLEELALVGELIGELRCHDHMAFSFAAWSDRLYRVRPRLPSITRGILDRDTVLLLAVGSVYPPRRSSQQGDDLPGFAADIIVEPMTSMGLKSIERIVPQINEKREQCIRDVLVGFDSLLDTYTGDNNNDACGLDCDSLQLGAMVKSLRSLGLYPCTPLAPYAGISVSRLRTAVESMRDLVSVCPRGGHSCSFKARLRALMKVNDPRRTGLALGGEHNDFGLQLEEDQAYMPLGMPQQGQEQQETHTLQPQPHQVAHYEPMPADGGVITDDSSDSDVTIKLEDGEVDTHVIPLATFPFIRVKEEGMDDDDDDDDDDEDYEEVHLVVPPGSHYRFVDGQTFEIAFAGRG